MARFSEGIRRATAKTTETPKTTERSVKSETFYFPKDGEFKYLGGMFRTSFTFGNSNHEFEPKETRTFFNKPYFTLGKSDEKILYFSAKDLGIDDVTGIDPEQTKNIFIGISNRRDLIGHEKIQTRNLHSAIKAMNTHHLVPLKYSIIIPKNVIYQSFARDVELIKKTATVEVLLDEENYQKYLKISGNEEATNNT